VELMAARAALARLADRRVVPAPRPSDAELLGALEDARQPSDTVQGSRRYRRILAHVELPEGSRGAAGLLLEALAVDPDRLRETVTAELGGIRR
jgi:hypothetical protein